jgi:hypothetical protein
VTTYNANRLRTPDFFWIVPLGGLFIIVGLTLAQYPDIFQLINNYARTLSDTNRPVMPPLRLGEAITFFFLVSGVWGLVAAGLRFVFGHTPVKAVGDIMGSFFAFLIAYLVFQYYHGTIRATSFIPLLIVGLGVVIIANAVASHLYNTRQQTIYRNSLSRNFLQAIG